MTIGAPTSGPLFSQEDEAEALKMRIASKVKKEDKPLQKTSLFGELVHTTSCHQLVGVSDLAFHQECGRGFDKLHCNPL